MNSHTKSGMNLINIHRVKDNCLHKKNHFFVLPVLGNLPMGIT